MRNLTIVIIILASLILGTGYLIYKEYTQIPLTQFQMELKENFDEAAIKKLKEYNLNDNGLFPLKDHLNKDNFNQPNLFNASF